MDTYYYNKSVLDMKRTITNLLTTFVLLVPVHSHSTVLNIATADNSDMLRMQLLAEQFTQAHPAVQLNWHFLDESVLRLALSRDSKKPLPEYDVYTIGILEAPTWGSSGRLSPVPGYIIDNLNQGNDMIETVLDAFSDGDQYYGLPFYGESSITYFRKDVLKRYDLDIGLNPNWHDIKNTLSSLAIRSSGRHGRICLRGKPGWGENMALVSTMVNAFGGRWFDMDWNPQINTDAWQQALSFYLDLQKSHGLPQAWRNGYAENLDAFSNGRCDIWVDSTAAASSLANTPFFEHIGYSHAPEQVTRTGSSWLWSWGFSVPRNSQHQEAAWRFVEWATSNQYHEAVTQEYGIVQVPPGTRRSLYSNPDYLRVAPFAEVTLAAIETANFEQSSMQDIPYRGIQFVQTTEFQQIGDFLGRKLAETLQQHMTDRPYDLNRVLNQVNDFASSAYNVAEYLRQRNIDAF